MKSLSSVAVTYRTVTLNRSVGKLFDRALDSLAVHYESDFGKSREMEDVKRKEGDFNFPLLENFDFFFF
jgi:hypothetical protein